MGSSSAPPSSRPLQGVRKLFQSFGRKTARPKHADAPASVSLQERLIPSTQLHNTLPEILLIIFDYLDTASLVCLQSTCKFLQNFIGIDPKSLDRCTRWLIMCYFEKDTLTAASLHNIPPPKTLCCAHCKTTHPRPNFDGISLHSLHPFPSPFTKTKRKPFYNRALPHLPSLERVCALSPPKIHYIGDAAGYNFVTAAGTPLSLCSTTNDGRVWLMVRLLSCSHCGGTISPTVDLGAGEGEGEGEGGNWERDTMTGCAKCRCATCPRVMRPHYLRCGKLWPGVRVLGVERFLGDGMGGLRVVERGAWRGVRVVEIGGVRVGGFDG